MQIDFLHGISLSVGRRFRQQCSSDLAWQGQLEKEDVILLTKLIHTKNGGSLYKEIAEQQAAMQIPASTILKLQDQCNSGQTVDEIRKILPPGYIASKRKVIIVMSMTARECTSISISTVNIKSNYCEKLTLAV